MTTIDGDRLPGSIPNVPGATLSTLELESVRTGRSRGELVALAVDAMFSTAAAPSPAGAVDGGQGATRPPAPTNAWVLVRETDSGLGAYGCTEGEQDEDGHSTCRAEAWWKLCVPGETRWTSDPETCGRACCDDHIPDGWVKPSATIATPLPHVHITDEPCVYSDRCGR